jgi:hypothetical protein
MSRWHHANTPDELEAFYLSILPKLRKVAKKHGYALGVHGSLKRDMDLIATPWIDKYSNIFVLAKAIQKAASGFEQKHYAWVEKPHGRIATAFPVCWSELDLPSSGHIDLSIITFDKMGCE